MLDIPEKVKQLCRDDNSSLQSWRDIEAAFFDTGIDTLYPSNNLYPSDDLYPADAGSAWFTITGEQMSTESFLMEENLCSADDLEWGSCEAAKVEFTVKDMETDILGKEFALTLSIGEYKMAFGMYTVLKAERQAERSKRKITAYDRMIRFDIDVADWYQALYPTDGTTHTVKEIRDSLCVYCNVPQKSVALTNDELVVGKTVDPQSLKGRDVLKAICEINGVFGHIDRTGQLTYVKMQKADLAESSTLYEQGIWGNPQEDLEYYRSITWQDYTVKKIDRVQIRQEEGDIGATAGSGTNAYVIEGNFLAYGLNSAALVKLAQSVLDVIGGYTYRPSDISTYAMPWIEVGDSIRAVTTDGEVATYVLKRTLKGVQAMTDTIEAKGSQVRESTAGDFRSEIIQLKGKTASIIKTVDEVSASVSDLAKNTTASIKVVSDAVTAEVKRAQGQEVELAASISVMAGQIQQKVSQGDLVAKINLEANKQGSVITMEAGHFVFKGSNFYVNADGSGGAANGNWTWDTAGNITVKGAKIDGTANTSSIGASTIYTNHLEVGGKGVFNSDTEFSGTMTCQNIDANKITCYTVYSSRAGETWSDKRLKTGIRDIVLDQAAEFIQGLRPVTYRMREGKSEGMGFIAQHVIELQQRLGSKYPIVGRLEKEKYYTICYQNLIPLIIADLQVLHKKLEGVDQHE